MARKVGYKSIKRPTKADPIGITGIVLNFLDGANNIESSIDLGTVERSGSKGSFSFKALAMPESEGADAEMIGNFETLPKAGEALRIHYDGLKGDAKPAAKTEAPEAPADEAPAEERLLNMDDAALELCGAASKPIDALKRRIKRGSIQTKEIDGMTLVVMPAE